MDIDSAIIAIKDNSDNLLRELSDGLAKKKVNGRYSYICPFCGHGTNGDGITINPKSRTKGIHCFGTCGFDGDIIHLYMQKYNTGFIHAIGALAKMSGITIDRIDMHGENVDMQEDREANEELKRAYSKDFSEEPKRKQDFAAYYNFCRKNLEESEEAKAYLQNRGISLETAKNFMLGFDPVADPGRNPGAMGEDTKQNNYPTPRIIIPITKNSYTARAIIPVNDAKYKYMNNKGGAIEIFCRNLMEVSNNPRPEQSIFVVEGVIDAISINEMGFNCIALNSINNVSKVIDFLKVCQKPTISKFIVLPDYETDYEKNQNVKAQAKNLVDTLRSMGKLAYLASFEKENIHDANSFLTSDRERFAKFLMTVNKEADNSFMKQEETKAQKVEEYKRKNSALASVEDFYNCVVSNTPPISTGFNNLDKQLDGGLYPGLYVLGAISSLGKTSFTLQLADQIASTGQDVLFICLEMSKREMIAKSISRYTYICSNDTRHAKSTRNIIQGNFYENYTDAEKSLINKAVEKYKEFAGNIFLHESVAGVDMETIKKILTEQIEETGHKPVVFVDYVQIIKGNDPRLTDKQAIDQNIVALKRLSREIDIPIFAISSFNRESYRTGKGFVKMSDFKESGAIEYTADVLIGLEFASAGDDYNESKAKAETPRRLNLVTLKNRNGKTGNKIAFTYNPIFNHFAEGEETTPEGFTTVEDSEDPFKSLRSM